MNAQFDEKGKIYTNVISKEPVLITIQTLTNRIHGEIYVRSGERLNDDLNTSDKFLAVTNACVYDSNGLEIYHSSFLALSLAHIVWLIPDDELINGTSDHLGGTG